MNDMVIPQDLIQSMVSDADVSVLTKATDIWPRIQINGSSSELAKSGAVPMGTHVLVYTKDKYADLGKEVPFWAINYRAKALRIPEDGSSPQSFFKRETSEFKSVYDRAMQPGRTGCMAGLEFLCYLPHENVFATYFCGNTTMRNAAPVLVALIKQSDGRIKPAKAKSVIKFIKNAKNSWHGADFLPCTIDFPAPPEDFVQKLQDAVMKFQNPPESQVEVVEAAPETVGRVR